jgi:hypothetical protein
MPCSSLSFARTRAGLALLPLALTAFSVQAEPQTHDLGRATVSLDTSPEGDGGFQSGFVTYEDIRTGETPATNQHELQAEHYRVTHEGGRLRIDFLPNYLGWTLSAGASSAYFGSPNSPIYSASALEARLPMQVSVDEGWRITGYRLGLGVSSSAVSGVDEWHETPVPYDADLRVHGGFSVVSGGETRGLWEFDQHYTEAQAQDVVWLAALPGDTDLSTLRGSFEGEVLDSGDGAFYASLGLRHLEVEVLTAPIPEPQTVALMLGGLGWLGWRMRHRATRAEPAGSPAG